MFWTGMMHPFVKMMNRYIRINGAEISPHCPHIIPQPDPQIAVEHSRRTGGRIAASIPQRPLWCQVREPGTVQEGISPAVDKFATLDM